MLVFPLEILKQWKVEDTQTKLGTPKKHIITCVCLTEMHPYDQGHTKRNSNFDGNPFRLFLWF